MAIAREAGPGGALHEGREAGLDRGGPRGIYRTMVITRGGRRPRGWFGEGASARGDAHESMTCAGTRKLPIVFVCDNSQWAYSTPTHLEYATEHVADRAEAYGFEGVVVDGTDVLAVYREAKRAIDKARAGGGPTLLECLTLRMEGHAVQDDAFYVPTPLLEQLAAAYPRDDSPPRQPGHAAPP